MILRDRKEGGKGNIIKKKDIERKIQLGAHFKIIRTCTVRPPPAVLRKTKSKIQIQIVFSNR